jgi:DNA-binding CsgD family transcriptional regulator
VAHAASILGFALVKGDRLEEAEQYLRLYLTEFERTGSVRAVYDAHGQLADLAQMSGRWDDAVAEVEAAEALREAMGIPDPGGTHLAHVSAYIALHRNDLHAVERLVAAPPAGSEQRRWNEYPWIEAILRGCSNAADGASLLAEAYAEKRRRGGASYLHLWLVDATKLALDGGRPDLAGELTADIESTAANSDAPGTRAYAVYLTGLCARDAERLREAVDLFGPLSHRVAHALASEDLARALASEGDIEQARGHFAFALDVYDALGARRDIARTESAMRDAGSARARGRRRERPATGWDALTDAERAVALLAAAGLTYPEMGARLFVSRRTVQTHLAHAFAKLGVSSRRDLARFAR